MIGIDTNVLLRLIVGDDPKQAVAVRNFLRESCSAEDPGHISDVVLVELAWTLTRVYGFARQQVADAIEQILETTQFDIQEADAVIEAVRDYRAGPCEFADCLIARLGIAAGCNHTITFDRKAAKQPGFKLLAG